MKAVTRFSLAALALGLVAAPASAQLAGLPVGYMPAGTGVTIGGTFGMGLNSDAENLSGDKTMSAGGMVTIGLPAFWVGAGASYFDMSGDGALKDISFGGQAGYKLPLAPGGPVSVGLVAGVSYMSNSDFDFKTLFVPAGLTIAFNVPSTSVSVTPWASPQFRWTRVSNGGSASEASFGASGGISIGLPVGVGFDLSVDWNRIPADAFGDVGAPALNPILVGFGVHYTIKTPGLGGGGM